MKTKLFFSTVIILIVLVFIIKKPMAGINEVTTENEPDNEFLLTATHAGVDANFSNYPDLGMNAWHVYTGPMWGWPNVTNDYYNVSDSVYGPSLVSKINLHRNTYGLRSVMDRPKIEYTAFGQRSDYQCEKYHQDADYWFYTYNTSTLGTYITDITDSSSFGNGAKVKYCQTNPSDLGSNAGYIVKGLRANREQSNRFWSPWVGDSLYEWYVMPKIRIDSSVAHNNSTTKVCSIIMIDWDGNVIDSVIILAGYFLDNPNQNYNGKYLEEYNFPGQNKLKINPGVICPGTLRKRFWDWGSINDTNTIKTDYRVYWYGLCDMWIDYVRVENLPAHQLFKGQWDNDIREETQLALNDYDPDNPIPNNFYMEEFEFNTVPCMAYVNNLIMDESAGKLSLMVNLNKKLLLPTYNSELQIRGKYFCFF